jgi:PAS domain S-box-containing protein
MTKPPPRILVVDDDAGALRNYTKLLEAAGYATLQSSKGQEVLEVVRASRPEIVLLDVLLPDISGFDVGGRLKADPQLRDTFVVLMSGAATRGGKKTLPLDACADAYMLKSSDAEEFLARIRTFIRLQATTAELRASERNYRELAENIREVFWITDPEKDRIIYVSPGYELIWGRTCESLYESPLNWIEAIHPSDRERVLSAALTKQVAGQYHEIYRIQRPDGSSRWIEDRAFPIRNESGAVTRVVGIADDITQRKRAEEALRESEMSKTAVMNSALDGIVTVDANGRILEFNPAAEKMFGCGRNQIVGRELAATLMPPSLRDWFARGLTRYFVAQEGPLGGRIETKALRADGSEFAVEFTITRVNLEGAPIATVFIRDITGRKRAEAQLTILAHAVESTAEPICITDLNDRFTFVNRAFQKIYGYAEEEVLGKSPDILFSPNNPTTLINEILSQTRRGGWRGEVLDKRKDGSEFPVSLSTSQIRDGSGEIVGLMGVATDISQRKLAEKRNAAVSQLGYRLSGADTREEAAEIILAIGSELFGWDAGYVCLYSRDDDKTIPLLTVDTVNGKRERFAALGQPIEPTPLMRRIIQHGPELIDPSRAQKLGLKLVPFGNKTNRAACMMFVPIHANNAIIGLVSIQSYTAGAYNGDDLNLLQSMADFCGGALLRIEATQSMRLAEAKYRGIFENATEGIFQTTQDGRYLNANPALARMFGYDTPAELIAAIANIERQTFADEKTALQLKSLLAIQEKVIDFEAERLRANGARFWTSINVAKVRDLAGKFLHYEGTVQDITKRKRAEKENIALSRLGYGLSAAGNPEEAAKIVLEIASELFGWDAAYVHLYSHAQDQIIPILTQDSVDGKRTPVQPETFTLEPSPLMRLVMKDGARLYDSNSSSSDFPSRVPFGDTSRRSASRMYVAIHAGTDVFGILSIQSYSVGAYTRNDLALLQTMADYCGDAFRRIEATEALRKAEQKYRSIFENATEGIFRSTPDGRVIAANQALAGMFGYETPEELMSSITNIGQQMYVSPQRRSDFKRLLESDGSVQDFEVEGNRRDGTRIWVHVNARVVRDEHGRNAFYEGTIQDITQNKRTEAILRESERKLRLISENSTDAIFAFDMQRRPVYGNPAVAELTGYAFSEIQERGFINWIHRDDQNQMLKLWAALFEGKAYSEVEFRLVTKTGHIKWCSSTWGPLYDEHGRQIGVQGRERDVTLRKQLEGELLEISGTERRRIGHELHDGLGQYLAGIAFRAKALEQRLSIAGSPDAQDAKELVSLMNQAISQTRNLARGMAPVDVEVNGLVAALQNLASETRHLFNSRCEVHCSNPDLQVDARTGLELYRIAQEAIHNAMKHGEAQSIDIKLRVQDQMLCLDVSDNGTGFEIDKNENSGMGLRLMSYRARSVGGSVNVISRPGEGAHVNCVVPLVCTVPLPNATSAINQTEI